MSEWIVTRFKTVVSCLETGKRPPDESEEVLSVGGEHIQNGKFALGTPRYVSLETYKSSRGKISAGDTLVVKDGATIGKCMYVDEMPNERMLLNEHVYRFHAHKFFYYWIDSDDAQCWFRCSNMSTAQESITLDTMFSLPVRVPSCEEQDTIVAYLDEKTAAIDARVAVLEKKLAAYKRLKKSIINRAVTRGLDPNVKLKDSGVDWIGQVPEGWGVKRVRDLGECSNGLSKGGAFFGHGSPFVSYGDVYRNPALPVSVRGLVESTKDERLLYSVKRGDILFTRTSETVEELGFASTCLADIPDATFAGFLIRVRPYADALLPEFSKHYFRGAFLRQYFIANTEIVTRASLSQDLLKGLPVLCPPLAVQRAIADYLDAECARIDKAATIVEKEIDAYKRLKRSLINEVVTGKRKVA